MAGREALLPPLHVTTTCKELNFNISTMNGKAFLKASHSNKSPNPISSEAIISGSLLQTHVPAQVLETSDIQETSETIIPEIEGKRSPGIGFHHSRS
ncbi:hypothetical protein NPIL_119641 [Nephila pilipes]|uniref:Uncharacterized protein n=1 Tax=Nephila pilipes TaxID=299642 RepID=A0A8X6P2N0_NEPPI|nr:hypothetical protein NPIL_119641 [Nephila pilipes]